MLLVGWLVVVGAAPDNAYLEQAQADFRRFEYARCLKSTALAARLETQAQRKAQIELLRGLCAFELGRKKDAEEAFELALRLDGAVALPALVSPKIETVFEGIRARVGPVPAALPPPAVEAQAPPPGPPLPAAVQAEAPGPSLLPSAVSRAAEPPTARRRWLLPTSLLGGAVVSSSVGLALGLLARQAESAAAAAGFSQDIREANGRAKGFALATNLLFAAASGLAIASLLTWLLSGL